MANETKKDGQNPKRWVLVDLSFFPFLKNGFHEFNVVKLHDSDTWENENGREITRYKYRCLPTDTDNLEDCADLNLYPVFISYDELKVGSTVLAKKETGKFLIYPITND